MYEKEIQTFPEEFDSYGQETADQLMIKELEGQLEQSLMQLAEQEKDIEEKNLIIQDRNSLIS